MIDSKFSSVGIGILIGSISAAISYFLINIILSILLKINLFDSSLFVFAMIGGITAAVYTGWKIRDNLLAKVMYGILAGILAPMGTLLSILFPISLFLPW